MSQDVTGCHSKFQTYIYVLGLYECIFVRGGGGGVLIKVRFIIKLYLA